MHRLVQRTQYTALVLALTLLPLTSQAAKPSYEEADQNGDGTVTVQEAKKVGVPEKEAKKEDLNGDGKLTKMDWKFVEMEAVNSSDSKSPMGSGGDETPEK